MSTLKVKALLCDVFGTVVDWRTSVAREVAEAARKVGVETDGYDIADAWRGAYSPSMQRVARGELPWTVIDDLHRAALDGLLPRFGLAGLNEAARAHLNTAWHRLDPWPDSVAGLARLKRGFIIGTLSNGNIALLVNMARHAALPWDIVFSAETFSAYKPDARTYDGAAAMLRLEPAEVMLVAAHNHDLAAAKARGLATAFIARPREYGPGQTKDLGPEGAWDIVAPSFEALANTLGC